MSWGHCLKLLFCLYSSLKNRVKPLRITDLKGTCHTVNVLSSIMYVFPKVIIKTRDILKKNVPNVRTNKFCWHQHIISRCVKSSMCGSLLKGKAKGGINFGSKGVRLWPFIGSLQPWLGSGFDQVFSHGSSLYKKVKILSNANSVKACLKEIGLTSDWRASLNNAFT